MKKLEFENITMEMRPEVMRYTAANGLRNSEYTFASLMMWGVDGRITLAFQDGAMYIRFLYPGYPMYMLSPLCLKDENYPEAIAKSEEYLRKNGGMLTFKGIAEKNTVFFRDAGYRIAPDRNNFDYVYNMEDLRTLAGKKYHGKRNHLNRFYSEYDFEYRRLAPEDAGECMTLYDRWASSRDEDIRDVQWERDAIQEGLTLMDELGLIFGGIYTDGALRAFSVAEKLDDSMAVVHFEKAYADIPGLYTAINQQMVEHELTGFRYINREEDMGLDGLRKAKLSYQPAMFVEKYIAVRGNGNEM